jgi:hypothetical protein
VCVQSPNANFHVDVNDVMLCMLSNLGSFYGLLERKGGQYPPYPVEEKDSMHASSEFLKLVLGAEPKNHVVFCMTLISLTQKLFIIL